MMKIPMKTGLSITEYFDDFIIAKQAQGLADKTIKSYKSHLKGISRHLDVEMLIMKAAPAP